MQPMRQMLIRAAALVMLLPAVWPGTVPAAASGTPDAVTLEASGSRNPGDAVTIRGTSGLPELVVQILRPNRTILWTDVVTADRLAAGVTVTLPADSPPGSYTLLAGSGGVRTTATLEVKERSTEQEQPSSPAIPAVPDPSGPKLELLPDGTAVIRLEAGRPDSSGTVKVPVPGELLSKASDQAGRVIRLELPSPEGASSVEPVLPVSILSTWEEGTALELRTGFAQVRLPGKLLLGEGSSGAAQVSVVLSKKDGSGLTDRVRRAVESKPLVGIQLRRDGQPVREARGEAAMLVELPYSPSGDESAHPEALVVWTVDEKGEARPVPNGRYHPDTGTVSFLTDRFGRYAVAYTPVSFHDLDASEWARKPVEALAAREVVRGTGSGEFAPGLPVKRADYVLLLMRALEPEGSLRESFADVPQDAYYYQAVTQARSLGIAGGDGSRFDPDRPVTRQEMMVLAARTVRAAKLGLAGTGGGSGLDGFKDRGQVADYAQESISMLVKLGIVEGTGGQLEPLRPASRAEAAALIHRVLSRLQQE